MVMAITRKEFLASMAGLTLAGGFLGRISEVMAQVKENSGLPVRSTRVRDVEVFPYSLKPTVAIKTALGGEPTFAGLFVRLRTEDGVVGFGEGSPFPPVTAETQQSAVVMAQALGDTLRGRNPFSVARIVADMNAFAPDNPSSKAALEMALWDICGKLAGQPVCCLLGRYRDSFETDKTVFLEPPDTMARTAAEVVRDGFKVIKVKVGESPDIDAERLRAIRKAVGPTVRIRIDANQGWSPAEAVKSLREIEKYQVEFAEQPVASWDWTGMKFVRDNAPMPIMADESVHVPPDAIEGIRKDAVDIINIKLMKSGGILQGLRIAEIADAANLKCMVGCMTETKLGLTAAAHLVCARGCIRYADLDAFLFLAEEPVIGGMEVKDGTVTLPQAPGLGVEVDPAFLARLHAA
jgi:L-alanine-DL-glutamate epimerase-like enolase superfamily enzyme